MNRHIRDILIEHMDREVVIVRSARRPRPGRRADASGIDGPDLGRRMQTISAALTRGWLRIVKGGRCKAGAHALSITDAGRHALAEELADWADAIAQVDAISRTRRKRVIADSESVASPTA